MKVIDGESGPVVEDGRAVAKARRIDESGGVDAAVARHPLFHLLSLEVEVPVLVPNHKLVVLLLVL